MHMSLLMRGIERWKHAPCGRRRDGGLLRLPAVQPGKSLRGNTGLKADGHAFISDALSRGAAFVVHEGEYLPPAGVTAIRVRDSRRTLGILGKNFFGDPSSALCLIAVVGTNGKTTVTYLIESILRAAGHSVGVLGTVNYRYGKRTLPAPNTTGILRTAEIMREMADHGVTHVVAEVSSHAVALKRVDDCAFDLGSSPTSPRTISTFTRPWRNTSRQRNGSFRKCSPPERKPAENDDHQRRRPLGEAHPC